MRRPSADSERKRCTWGFRLEAEEVQEFRAQASLVSCNVLLPTQHFFHDGVVSSVTLLAAALAALRVGEFAGPWISGDKFLSLLYASSIFNVRIGAMFGPIEPGPSPVQ